MGVKLLFTDSLRWRKIQKGLVMSSGENGGSMTAIHQENCIYGSRVDPVLDAAFRTWYASLPDSIKDPIGMWTSDYWTYSLMAHPSEYGYSDEVALAARLGVEATPYTVFIWSPGGMGMSRLSICPDFRTTSVEQWKINDQQ